jgi:rhodanese-related sulfurtransferase
MALFRVTTERGADVIDPADALRRLDSDVPPVVLDLRTEAEYRHSHILGAHRISGDDLGRTLAALPADREYMTVCRSGARGGVAAWQLRAAGFTVSNLCGGLLAWQRAGFPLEYEDEMIKDG